jgi:tRNA1Val (adenine37-N6)-methyltransferase
MIKLVDGERIDKTGFSDIKVIQNPKEFCYGIDAVLLSAFASGETGASIDKNKISHIADLGTGNGIIPFILSHKTDAKYILGVEKQKSSYDRAIRALEENNLSVVEFINSDILELHSNNIGKFDVVTSNPPYKKIGSGIKSSSEAKHIARHETTAELEDFIACASKLLKKRGHFFLVQRPSRLSDIICFCREYDIEPKELQMVAPRFGEKPNIMLMHGIKSGKNELNVLQQIIVYEGDSYTQEILRLYER